MILIQLFNKGQRVLCVISAFYDLIVARHACSLEIGLFCEFQLKKNLIRKFYRKKGIKVVLNNFCCWGSNIQLQKQFESGKYFLQFWIGKFFLLLQKEILKSLICRTKKIACLQFWIFLIWLIFKYEKKSEWKRIFWRKIIITFSTSCKL